MPVFSFEPDYTGMRIITDDVYAALIAYLAKDEKVALFQKLLLSKKGDDDTVQPESHLNERVAEDDE